jgi:hypothetical protein
VRERERDRVGCVEEEGRRKSACSEGEKEV